MERWARGRVHRTGPEPLPRGAPAAFTNSSPDPAHFLPRPHPGLEAWARRQASACLLRLSVEVSLEVRVHL